MISYKNCSRIYCDCQSINGLWNAPILQKKTNNSKQWCSSYKQEDEYDNLGDRETIPCYFPIVMKNVQKSYY